MAGEGCIDGDAGGFQIADLTDHDDVRRLTQNGAQGAGEGHSDLGLHVHLVDAGHDVFDRILDRDDLAALVVDLRKAGVERGCFSGSGRTGDEDDAVGHFDQAAEIFLVVAHEAEVGQRDGKRRLVEKTHDDGFALRGRNGGNAQVERLALDLALDAAVLGDTFFVDAHGLRHDLQTAHDGPVQGGGEYLVLLEFAVDAEADAETFVHRLEVNVACAHALGLLEEVLHQLDDGGIVVAGDAFFFLVCSGRHEGGLPRVDVGQQRVDALRVRVEEFHFGSQKNRHRVERLEVHRVTDGHLQPVVAFLQRQDPVPPGHIAGDELMQILGALDGIRVVQIRIGQPVEVRHGLVDITRTHRAVLEQGLDDRCAGVLLARLADLLFGHPKLVEKNFEDLVVGVHGGGGTDCLRLRPRGVKEPGRSAALSIGTQSVDCFQSLDP